MHIIFWGRIHARKYDKPEPSPKGENKELHAHNLVVFVFSNTQLYLMAFTSLLDAIYFHLNNVYRFKDTDLLGAIF